MNTVIRRFMITGTGIGYALIALTAANAQDIEIFTGNGNPGNNAKPNILFILDDSGSMGSEVITQNNYDPNVTYAGTCSASRVYWTTNSSPPSCWTSNYFEMSAFQCERAREAFRANQGGSYQDYFAQYDPGRQDRWERLSNNYHTRIIECQDDSPDPEVGWAGHGNGSDPGKVYPQDGDQNNLWTSDPNDPDRITWGTWPVDQRYNVYSGNYMNWYYGTATTSTRIEVMQEVANNLINSINGVNIGLMSFEGDEGGRVRHAVEDVATSRTSMETAVNSLTAGGFTPLSETLYEAYQYMTGGPVVYGTNSVAESREPDNPAIYNSPMDLSCQKNHIVLLTDGEPTRDVSADDDILGLIDAEGNSFASLVGGSCDAETYPVGFNPSGGECLDELAEFMYKGDLSPLAGTQNIVTHTVGFLIDLPILEETAARGGGEYRTAKDTASLTTALTSIVTSILDTQATFTAPSISINAFNQTRHLNDIYVGLFRPSNTSHWPGNLKKFRLRAADSTIVDKNDMPIIDPATGVFADYVQDFWSATQDGTEVTAGGAANKITAGRTVFSYLNSSLLTSPANQINLLNLTDLDLGTGDPSLPTAQEVVDFINGYDVGDEDQDGDTTEARTQIGDPLHSRPVVVVYGPDNDDALVFMGTNDGMLHAINVSDGTEEWAFLPPEFIGQQLELLVDNTTDSKTYGIDGSIRVQTIADSNGVIEKNQGEQVILFFGMRRGGDVYYALDVTDPNAPEVLWRKDSGDLPGLGQSWSSATPTRIDIQGETQNQYKLALVVGGGYDASQDASMTSTDSSGNSIYILDTISGDLLWHGTNSGGDQNFSTANWSMDYSIPADIRVIDLNGDGFGDRMYAADMGGQVWRFDITNGNYANNLVAGGVIAQLGAAGLASPSVADTRRFYYAPDVALVRTKDYNFIHIGVGSGHRAHPNSSVNHDEFYALRDYTTFSSKTQTDYNNFTPVVPTDLVDITTNLNPYVPQGSPGWRLSFNDGGWIGEKVLAETRTFDSKVYVSTYRPGINGVSCEPALGTTRQYIVSLFNGRPVNNLDGSAEDYNGDGVVDPTDLQLTDRYREYQGPPPPETVFFFPGPEQDTDGDGIIDDGLSLECVADGDCLGETPCQGLICFENDEPRFPTRTFWSQDDIEE